MPEECDDRNLADGDGCDSNCTITACGNGIATAATGEVILPIGSTTTTLSMAPTQESVEGSEGSDSAGSALESPISAAGPSADDGNTQSGFPVAAVAGVVTALVAAGAWWLIGIKRGAMAAVARPSWEIPHGGVRPPQ